MDSQQEKVGYILGRQVAGDIQRQGIDLVPSSFVKGVQSIFDNESPLLSDDEIRTTMERFQKEMAAKQATADAANVEEGKKFLEENASKPGVVTTASGLQYKVLTEGTGPKPSPSSQVVTHYEGTLIDGSVFDSSYSRGEPITFPVGGVIQGWQEALALMPQGSKWQLYIPSDLAYGAAGSPPVIGPNAVLLFTMELLEIK